MHDTDTQESATLREARETIYDCYEWNPVARVDEVYERNGRIYFVTSATSAWTPPHVLIHRYNGMRELERDGFTSRGLDSDEVGTVLQDGSTCWYDDDELAEVDHAGDGR